jgi:hypothetical protein
MKLATFDGSIPWLEYEAYFDQYAKVHEWDDTRKAQFLSLSLRGPAQSILLSLKLTDSLKCDDIKKALEQYFCPPEKVHVYQAELQGRKLKPDEELNDLARDIRTKTRLAYPEADEKTLEYLMKNYFCSSLTDSAMRLSVAQNHPKNLTQALANATEYSSIMDAEWTQEGKAKSRQVKPTPSEPVPTDTNYSSRLDALERVVRDLQLDLTHTPRFPRTTQKQAPGPLDA